MTMPDWLTPEVISATSLGVSSVIAAVFGGPPMVRAVRQRIAEGAPTIPVNPASPAGYLDEPSASFASPVALGDLTTRVKTLEGVLFNTATQNDVARIENRLERDGERFERMEEGIREVKARLDAFSTYDRQALEKLAELKGTVNGLQDTLARALRERA